MKSTAIPIREDDFNEMPKKLIIKYVWKLLIKKNVYQQWPSIHHQPLDKC